MSRDSHAREQTLCVTCRLAQVIQGFVETQEQTWCFLGRPVRPVPFPVRLCTDYEDKRLPDLSQMEKVALLIDSGRGGRSPGFVAPLEAQTEEDEQTSTLPISASTDLA